jgi:Rrf2 family protein
MKLQIASLLAVYAVLELASDPDRQLSAAEIGAKFGMSTHHLAKVLHTLGRAGMVRSVRGAGGGYQFTGNVKRMTLLDVISLFEPIGEHESGQQDRGADTDAGQALTRIFNEIDANTLATLNSVTISTMLKIMQKGAAAPNAGTHP